jgi:hypothetical protein
MFRRLQVRRPSAALVISLLALFCALGGASWAAIHLPDRSVGTAQLRRGAVTSSKIRNGAVTYRKIALHSVGVHRANTTQLQARVLGTCSGASALSSIAQDGKVNCHATLPRVAAAAVPGVKLGSSATTVVSKTLSPGSYLLLANPGVAITTSASGAASVTCTLSAPAGQGGQGRTVEVQSANAGQHYQLAMALQVPVTLKSGTTAAVSCSASGPASSVSVGSALDALQVLGSS